MSQISSDSLQLLDAAKNGDGEELDKLLNSKLESYDSKFAPIYPDDYRYEFSDLLLPDGENRTALQLACSVGNHDNALKCVQLLCESIQVLVACEDGTAAEKLKKLIEFKIRTPGSVGQTPIHFAIENRATKVIAYLLDRNANLGAKSLKSEETGKKPTNALKLICQKVPDALLEVYDNAIELSKDHKQIELNLAVLIGIRKRKQAQPPDREKIPMIDGDKTDENNCQIHVDENEDHELWRETEYLSYILEADNWGAKLLLHPLVKLFLQMKWKRVQRFFWIPFCLQILWLFLYSAAFVQLHLYMESVSGNETHTESNSESSTGKNGNENDKDPNGTETIILKPPFILWTILFFITLLGAGKEIYIAWVLKKHYLTFEKFAQVSFILLFFIQFALLVLGYMERAATISVVGIVTSTIVLIFKLGKLNCFGQQVAAMKKVVSSFIPHMPLFFVWFLGFCLIFWALFYKSNESSVIVLLAIVAAMGTGEINAKDHLEESLKRSAELHDWISVFCLMLFIITIVTLYFNLLIGYAVSDIHILKEEAEAYEMSNRLSTIIATESFLLSKMGQWVVRLFQFRSSDGHYMDSIYVKSPSQFQKSPKLILQINDIPPEIREKFKTIAYGNLLKGKEQAARLERQLKKLQQKGDKKEIDMGKLSSLLGRQLENLPLWESENGEARLFLLSC